MVWTHATEESDFIQLWVFTLPLSDHLGPDPSAAGSVGCGAVGIEVFNLLDSFWVTASVRPCKCCQL